MKKGGISSLQHHKESEIIAQFVLPCRTTAAIFYLVTTSTTCDCRLLT
ncbi:hypothetical protein BVRB_011300 [Beta vulgaris subsp. vulgaris]|uniref:Uncharacterized protein n=1 Tax=Beta vulgaris subsp. vulgaris TaxID=3555 RepID=A0A0J8DWH6_BETVV|nr:hypothetical protein BVRB_011300 [Beta vulgaris subsp. vulgaris]